MTWIAVVKCDGVGHDNRGCSRIFRRPEFGYDETGWSLVPWPGFLRKQAHLCPMCTEVKVDVERDC